MSISPSVQLEAIRGMIDKVEAYYFRKLLSGCLVRCLRLTGPAWDRKG
jgi:hypothetical protein